VPNRSDCQNRCASCRFCLLTVAFLVFGGCGSLGPGFVDLLEPAGAGDPFTTIENAPGHIIVAFVNKAEVDERLLSYLESAEGGGLVLSDLEKRALRPRIRFRVLITFAGGEQQTVEFIDGSGRFVQPGFNAESEPDLNQNKLDNAVVTCEVARVEILEPVEVFVPVVWTVFDFVEPTGLMPGFFRPALQFTPRFEPLQADEVDVDLNILLRQNVGIRDRPAPVDGPLCGSLISVVVDCVLSVPFFDQMGGVPGYEQADLASAAVLGGRYEFRVSVQ